MRRFGVVLALCLVLGLAAPVLAAGKFEGITLVVGGESGLTINAVKWYGPEWAKATGGKIQVVEHPFGSLFEKFMTSFVTGTAAYDVIVFPADWAGDIMGGGYLQPLTSYLKTNEDWPDILPLYRERIASWGGTVYAMPLDGDNHILYYRKDVLADAEYKDRFKKKYGYELAPPQTWEEYHDIAEFFNGWDWNRDGKAEYGTVESMGRNGQSYWWFFTRSACYACFPGQEGSLFFDPETMKPTVNDPGHVKGLEMYVNIVKCGPPGMINYQVGDVRADFPAGKAVLAVDWGDIGPMSADPKTSKVRGRVGYSVLPGTTKVWNRETGKWVTFDKPSHAPFIAFGGWVGGITKTCRNKNAAYDFLKFLNSKKQSLTEVTTGGTGFNPYRASHFSSLAEWKNLGFDDPKPYLDAIRDTINHPNAQLDLRIPGAASYFEVLDLELSRALAGEIPAKQALDNVAREWEKLTDKLGREKQLRYYRQSLGLPVK